MTNWRIYGTDTIACKLGKAELPGFFQKKITVGPHEAALIVKNGKILETITQSKEVALGFWERLKSVFGADTDVEVFIVDTSPVDIVIYLGMTNKDSRSASGNIVGPTETNATLQNRTNVGARAAGAEVIGPTRSQTPMFSASIAAQQQRDVSNITLLAVSSDLEPISAECRLRLAISLEDMTLLESCLRGRTALATWDLTALIRDEMLAKVLLPRIRQYRSDQLHADRELLKSIENDVGQEMLQTFSTWGLSLGSFIINWGLTQPELVELDKKRQTRQEEALDFAQGRRLADMRRDLEIETTRIDNLKQLKIAEAKGDEDLKALYVAAEVDRANVLDGKRLNIAIIDNKIAMLQLDVDKHRKDIQFEDDKRTKELDAELLRRRLEQQADLEARELKDAMSAYETVQGKKRERQKQEQDFMTQQMNIQTGSIERLTSQGIDKGVVDGATIQEIARQFTAQRMADRTDAKVDSFSQAEAAKANVNTFKDAEDRERKHQVDMTSESSKMMNAAKQNVPDTLVQGAGVTPSVHVSVPTSANGYRTQAAKCGKCGLAVHPGWRVCPECGESLPEAGQKCSCGAAIEPEWKVCPFCGKELAS